jgi:protein-S-isoprenylcysteine O-methyltransferase Ste14
MSQPESGIRIIPPFVFLAAYLIAWFDHWLLPIGFGLSLWLRLILGVVLIAAPLAIVPSLFAAFRRADSEYDVRKIPKGLVTEGLFRYSRNPGYVAMIMLSFGVAVIFDNVWVLVLLVPAIVIIRQEVILKEEAILEREFGGEYLAYRRRVRRWI